MDMFKILQKLWERAESTDFEAEREACLKKIEHFKQKYPGIDFSMMTDNRISLEQVASMLTKEQLRKIFLETYFEYYLDDFEISEENVPVRVDFFFLETVKHQADETIRNFPNNKKLYKNYCELIAWAREVEKYYKWSSVYRHFSDRNHFIFIDLETAYFIEAFAGGLNDIGLNALYEKLVNDFNESKERFLKDVNSGYYDSTIKAIFDPTLLEYND